MLKIRPITKLTTGVLYISLVMVAAGCSDSGERATAPSVITVEHVTASSVVTPAAPKAAVHKAIKHHVIYAMGEYPYRPGWMSQRQWDSYIDWESKQQSTSDNATAADATRTVDAARKDLREAGDSIRDLGVTPGAMADVPVPGWIGTVELYGDDDEDSCRLAAAGAMATLLSDSSLKINRVLVSVYDKDTEKSHFCMQEDNGSNAYVVQDFTP